MGHDVVTIGNHKLSTENIALLAEDIAQRLNGIVIYGYINDWHKEDEWRDFNFVEQGQTGQPGGKIYCLIDTHYWDRNLKPEEYEDNIAFEMFDRQDHYSYSCYILKNSFILNAYFFSRWWSFCRTFMGELISREWVEHVEDHRKLCKDEIEQFGGDMALHLDDQGQLDLNEWDFEVISFNDGLNNLRSKENVIDIGTWTKSGRIPVQEYPVAFIDDFTDL